MKIAAGVATAAWIGLLVLLCRLNEKEIANAKRLENANRSLLRAVPAIGTAGCWKQ